MTDDDARLDALHADLLALRDRLRTTTRERHQRLNPFAEDLADWRERARFWLGEDRGVTLYESATIIGDVEVGAGTWIGPFCLLDGSGGLSVGHHCSLATGSQLLSHDTVEWALSGGVAPPRRRRTTIGDCCFVGTHAIVMPGVDIADQCVVNAGAVVTGDVPPRSIVAGVPARPVGRVHVDDDGAVSLVHGDAPQA